MSTTNEENEDPKLERQHMSRVRGSLNATISGKTDQVSCFLAHNGSGVLGQNGFFWHP